MTPDNVSIIKQAYDGFARGDVPGVLALFDSQIEWREAEGYAYADGNPYVGPDKILHGVFMRLGSEWDGFSVTPNDFIKTEDGVLVMGRYGGTYRATGRRIDAQFAHLWRISSGKIRSFQQFADTAQMAAAMKA